jgi:hypothetical protein
MMVAGDIDGINTLLALKVPAAAGVYAEMLHSAMRYEFGGRLEKPAGGARG